MNAWDRRDVQAVAVFGLMQNPENPTCPGPVAFHLDGVMQCLGGCDCVADSFHDDETPEHCNRLTEDQWRELTRHCARCEAFVRRLALGIEEVVRE